MPTITRTTGGMIAPDQATIQNRVTAIRSAFYAGNLIKASDVNEVNSIFIYFNDHYHSTADLYASGNYGNTSPYPAGDSYDTNPENTSTMIDARGLQGTVNDGGPGGVNAGDIVYASWHEGLRNMYNAANGHYHNIDDRTG